MTKVKAQSNSPVVAVTSILLEYQGDTVKAKKLSVSSSIPIPIDQAWENVKTPALLQYVAKGMIKFKPAGAAWPKEWVVGQTYGVKMRVFGLLPFGGVHHLYIEQIDADNYQIVTREWDKRAKVWNHTIVMRAMGEEAIYYEDSIVIYGGAMTGFITAFAKKFYKHRQRRWQKIAKEKLNFSG